MMLSIILKQTFLFILCKSQFIAPSERMNNEY